MSLDIKKFIDGLHDYLGNAFSPLVARMNALEARLNVLEQRETKSLADSYAGGWQSHTSYSRGSLTTFHGSLWLALESTTDRPASSAAWRMIVRGSRE